MKNIQEEINGLEEIKSIDMTVQVLDRDMKMVVQQIENIRTTLTINNEILQMLIGRISELESIVNGDKLAKKVRSNYEKANRGKVKK